MKPVADVEFGEGQPMAIKRLLTPVAHAAELTCVKLF